MADVLAMQAGKAIMKEANEQAIKRALLLQMIKEASEAAAKETGEAVLKKAGQEALKEAGEVAVKKVSKEAMKEAGEKVVTKAGTSMTKGVIKGATVALTGVFIVFDIKDLINNVESMNEVSAVTASLNQQASCLESGIHDLENLKKRIKIKLKASRDTIEVLKKMKKAYKMIRLAKEYGFTYFFKLAEVVKAIVKVKQDVMNRNQTKAQTEEKEEEEEEEIVKVPINVGTLNIRSLGSQGSFKPNYIKRMIEKKSTDILCLTETWFLNGDISVDQDRLLRKCCPSGYTYENFPNEGSRPKKGVGMIINESKLAIDSTTRYDFDSSSRAAVHCGVVQLTSKEEEVVKIQACSFYSPPVRRNVLLAQRMIHLTALYAFLELNTIREFAMAMLANRSFQPKECIISGDFNVHMNREGRISRYVDWLNGLLQYTRRPQVESTHKNGNTLDLILSKSDEIRSVEIDPSPYLAKVTDHYWLQETVIIKRRKKRGQ